MTAYTAPDPPDKPPDIVTISRFRHKRDTAPRQERQPWDGLTRLLSRHAVRREKDGPLWSPVRFRPGTERAAANVEAVTELVYDVDHVPPDWNLLDGVAFVAYTTYSHTADDPHWRLVLRLARPVPARVGDRLAPGPGALCADGRSGLQRPGQDVLPAHLPAGAARGRADRRGYARRAGRVAGDAGGGRGACARGGRAGVSAAGSAGRRSRRWGAPGRPLRPPGDLGRTAGATRLAHGRNAAGPGGVAPARAGRTTARPAARTRPATATSGSGRAAPRHSSPSTSYTKLHAYVLLEHRSDWTAADQGARRAVRHGAARLWAGFLRDFFVRRSGHSRRGRGGHRVFFISFDVPGVSAPGGRARARGARGAGRRHRRGERCHPAARRGRRDDRRRCAGAGHGAVHRAPRALRGDGGPRGERQVAGAERDGPADLPAPE